MAMVALFAALSFGGLARALRADETRHWLIHGACLVATFYCNALAGILVAAPQVYWALVARPRRLRRLATTLALSAVALAPLIVLSLIARSRWDPFYWDGTPGIGDLRAGVSALFGGSLVILIAALALGAAALSTRPLPRLRGRLAAHPTTLLAVWALVPPLLLFALSLATPLWQSRYAIGALGGAALLVGTALASLPRRAFPLCVAAVLVVAGVATAARLADPRDEWQRASHFIAADHRPGDPVIFDTHSGVGPAGYYERAFRSAGGLLINASWRDVPVPDEIVLLDDPGGYGRVPAGPPSPELVRSLLSRTGRLIVVLSSVDRAQRDVWSSPGLLWARSRCAVARDTITDVTVVTISSCRQVSRVMNCAAVPGFAGPRPAGSHSQGGVLDLGDISDITEDLRPCPAGDSLRNCRRTHDSGH
jgi:hypothetical protein